MFCNRHNEPMTEVRNGAVNVDVCPLGCVHLDPGELDALLGAAVSSHGGNYQHMPSIPQGHRVRNPLDYVTHGFGSHGQHSRRHYRSRSHSGGFFGSDGIFGS